MVKKLEASPGVRILNPDGFVELTPDQAMNRSILDISGFLASRPTC
jgi:hypothetical protein